MGNTLPLYLQIQQHLLEKIHNGDWAAHHQTPPEEQLARDFGVSRMTANKAIRDLVQQGYLIRQAGVGTFVTDRKAESSLLEVHNIADEIRSRGHEHDCVLVVADAHNADDEVSCDSACDWALQSFIPLFCIAKMARPFNSKIAMLTPATCRII